MRAAIPRMNGKDAAKIAGNIESGQEKSVRQATSGAEMRQK
jgi:hypothetical protein